MAVLIEPRIEGPTSICNTSVRVESVITGATVTVVTSEGESLGTVDAGWSRVVVELNRELRPGERIGAQQIFEDITSNSPREFVTVQDGTRQSGEPGFVATAYPIFTCSQCVRVVGAIPGSKVMATISDVEVGVDQALHGIARVQLEPGISMRSPLLLSQTACDTDGPELIVVPQVLPNTPAGAVTPPGLPRPDLLGDLRPCQRAILVSGVVPGATAVYERRAIENGEAIISGSGETCFDGPALWWTLGEGPLKENEQVRVAQMFPSCDLTVKNWSNWKSVELRQAPAPVIIDPLCPGSSIVTLSNLIPGSRFYLTYSDGEEIGIGEASNVTQTISVPPLESGKILVVSQEICEVFGPSAMAPITETRQRFGELTTADLYECASAVVVFGGSLGTRIDIRDSETNAAISAPVQKFTDPIIIPIAPSLQQGQKIYVEASGCGNAERTDSLEVLTLPTVQPPRIASPIYEATNEISLSGLIPGAAVDIFRDGSWETRFIAVEREQSIRLSVATRYLQVFTARQLICKVETSLSNPRTISRVHAPRPPEIIQPVIGGRDTSRNPILSWSDPSRGGENTATSFEVETPDGDVHTVEGTSLSLDTRLEYGTRYTWRVRSFSRTERASAWTMAHFTTIAEPRSTTGDPDLTTVERWTFSGVDFFNCTADKLWLVIWMRELPAGPFRELGTIAPQYDDWGTCPSYGTQPFRVNPTNDGSNYEVVAVAPDGFVCGGRNDPTQLACRKYTVIFKADRSAERWGYIIA